MLNEVPNRNDATGVANNVRLTSLGAKQCSMAIVYLVIIQKVNLPEMRDSNTKTIKVHVDGNNIVLGKNEGYMPSSLGNRLISVGRQ